MFTPIYEIYNDTFLREIIARTKIDSIYGQLGDTAWYEKYMLNSYQFSAAKSVDKAKKMQAAVYDEEGKVRSWPQFRNAADAIQVTENKNWLRVERDMCQRSAIMADKFNDMREDVATNPYWIYVGRLDSKERPEHRALEGLIFRIGDRHGDNMFPPSDWNCRCTGKPVDDLYLRRHNRSVQTDAQAKGWLEGNDENGKPFVDEQFRYNPADQGMMPLKGRYFEQWKSANEGNATLFGVKGKEGPELEGFTGRQLPHLPAIIEEWKSKYHTTRIGNIILQSRELLSNITITHTSLHQIHKHPRGVELLPETLMNPDEVWSRWENPLNQVHVLRNYILYGDKISYIVQTKNGVVQDAFVITRGQAERFRIGCPWFK